MAQFTLAFGGDEAGLRKWLISNKGKVNIPSTDRTSTLVYTAARGGHLGIVTMLVEDFGADVLATNGSKGGLSNALHGACYGGHHEVVKYVLLQPGGRDLRGKKNEYGETPKDNAKSPAEGVKKGDAKKCIAYLDNPPKPPSPSPPPSPKKKADSPPPPPPAPPAASPQKGDSMSLADLMSKGLAELRAMCTKLGLTTTGAKKSLAERLVSQSQGKEEKKEGDDAPKVGSKSATKHDETAEEKKAAVAEEPSHKKQKPEAAEGSNNDAWIEALKTATFTKTEVERDTEDFWDLETKVTACMQGRNEDYVQNRIKKKKKPLTFIIKNAWTVQNDTLVKGFNEVKAKIKAGEGGAQHSRVRTAFHGTKPMHIDSILKTSLLRFKHPLNPCKEQADDGYFGTNKKGVYVSRYFDYCLKYCNGLNPLEENETAKVIMFDCLPGKVFHVDKLNMGMDPHTEGNHHSHSSPSHLEWYLFDECQLNPTHIIELQAKLDTRTAADDE